jgi:Uma2 family endonuclease
MATMISPIPSAVPTSIPSAIPAEWTLADMLEHLGDLPPNRIRMYPPLGTATEKDVLEAESRFGRICELVDGVLVEKTMGYYESMVASEIIRLLGNFVHEHDPGIVLGEAGTLRVLPSQVRIPDVCFIAWERFPGRRLPAEPIPALAPDLAIEVLSEGNTKPEMERKLRDYFAAGVRLVWYVDPGTRTARVYTAPDGGTPVEADGVLSGGDVLPGFELPMKDLFAYVEGQRPA